MITANLSIRGDPMQPKAETVRAVNRLTRRWAGAQAGVESTVFSSPSLWPLLALLADPAAGPARQELEEAVGVRADRAIRMAHDLLDAFSSIRGTRTALGLWTAEDLSLYPEWTLRLPTGLTGRLDKDPAVSRKRLDAWAAEHTDGLIPSMPVQVDDATQLVLAGAQLVRTRWLRPFTDTLLWPQEGPWRDRPLLGLHRTSSLLDRLAVVGTPSGPLTVLKVLGSTGVDVHLLLGPAQWTPSEVLAQGIDALHGEAVTGDRLPLGEPGPGVSVTDERGFRPDRPQLHVTTTPFRIEAHHDLMVQAALYGLVTASDGSSGHFPGIGPSPLAVQRAAQSALAVFDAKGFESAAVSAVLAAPGSAPPRRGYPVRRLTAPVDRPFGFLTVHRTSRLVLAAGWVADPVPYPEDDRR
ncbi:serpin family protein [Streptomyces sp. N35]|uniref:serpin family protein n=1 Tax=Streptomyces sp. N35 TaxID=2795730 RepID=UPI001F3E8388|nr:serpin family protein [Streptomyces sp. N35]